MRKKYTYNEIIEIVNVLDLNITQNDLIELCSRLDISLSRSRIHQLRKSGRFVDAIKPGNIEGPALYSPLQVRAVLKSAMERQHITRTEEEIETAIAYIMEKGRERIRQLISRESI